MRHSRQAMNAARPRRAPLAGLACALLLWLGAPSALKGVDLTAQSNQGSAAAAQQACPTFRVREQDQIWLVSTRHLGCSVGIIPTFQIWRYEKGTWQPKT